MGPLLQSVQVPLDGFPSFQCIDCTNQLGVICKLAEGALNATVYVIDKEHQSLDPPLRDTSCVRVEAGHKISDHKPLAATSS